MIASLRSPGSADDSGDDARVVWVGHHDAAARRVLSPTSKRQSAASRAIAFVFSPP